MFVQTDNFGYSSTYKAELFEGVYNYPMHLHQYAEIVYVYDGMLELTTGNGTERISKGEFAFLMPFQAHKLHTPKYCKALIYVFSDILLGDFYDKNALTFGEVCVFTPTEPTRAYVLNQLEIAGRYSSGNSEDSLRLRKIKAGIYALAEEYFRSITLSKKNGENDMLSKLLIYIHSHLCESITLAKMAQEYGYNPNYISHCFKSIMGMNFCTFLNCLRVEKAKALLTTTRLSVAEISDKCGFTCERNFHRAFKSVTDTTPLKYRIVSANDNKYANTDNL